MRFLTLWKSLLMEKFVEIVEKHSRIVHTWNVDQSSGVS